MVNQNVILLCLSTWAAGVSAWPSRKKTPTFKYAAVFSVDGMHNSDIDRYLAKGASNMSMMLQNAYRYSSAYTPGPSDSFPGTAALFTGGLPPQTGVWYDDVWDRSLYAPKSNCTGPAGAEVVYDETVDYNSTLLFSGGIDPTKLPKAKINGTCTPVYPHMRLRINTAFEVVVGAGKKTAYADKHPAYDLVNGPSGKGVSSLYTPEINYAANPTSSVANCTPYDQLHVNAFLSWLDGSSPVNSTGSLSGTIPTLYGGNFQSVSVGQKTEGYVNDTLDFTPDLLAAFNFVDASLGAFIRKLTAKGLYNDTLIVVCSKHGQAPINPAAYSKVDPALVEAQIGVPHNYTTYDDVALIFLNSQSDLNTAVANLQKNKTLLQIDDIIYGQRQTDLGYGSPKNDSAVPDIIVKPTLGTIYTTSKSKIAEHGGLSDDDRHVACFAHNPQLEKRVYDKDVSIASVAPTVLKALGLDQTKLQGHARLLPGFH